MLRKYLENYTLQVGVYPARWSAPLIISVLSDLKHIFALQMELKHPNSPNKNV